MLSALILINGCIQDKCGDGICQKGEEKRGGCPADCETTTPANPQSENDVCGNNIYQPEKGENSDNWAVNRAMFSPDGKIVPRDGEWSMEKYPGIGSY